MVSVKTVLDLIGETPLIKLNHISKKNSNIFAKLERTNPSGSIKDRAALFMIEAAEKEGLIKPGMKIIEPTSGNTGVAMAMVSAVKGYDFTAVMPESMSVERRQMIKAFGGKVVLTPGDDMNLMMKKAKELAKREDVFMPNQFSNLWNIEAHKGTGYEILRQTNGKVDVFVAAAGTGGTTVGIAQVLKAKNPKTKVVIVEPENSAVLSGKKSGHHKVQGIGEGFIPKNIKMEVIDEIETVNDKEAYDMTRKLAKREGLLVGISSGANVSVAKKYADKLNTDKKIVTILPDNGERYLSVPGLFER